VSDYQPRAQYQPGRNQPGQYQPGNGSGWPAQPPSGPPAGDPGGYGRVSHGAPAGRPPRRRRHRGLIALLVVLVLLVVIAAVGDQVARSYAESRAAAQIQTSAKLSAKPSVSIKGWPFLTQLASRDFSQVDISANNVTADSGKLTFSFSAKATGVHFDSSFERATADHITGSALLPFASLDAQVGNAAQLSADPADGPNAIKVSLGGLGSLTGKVELVSPTDIAIKFSSATGLASLFGGLSGQTTSITVPTLPAGMTVKSVTVNSQGIVATATASNTTLSQ
jgi:hypothetical protein